MTKAGTATIATMPAGVESEGASWQVQGIDVSKWQGGDFDFARAKSEGGFSFAFLRATVGTSQDPQFARNWHECARADMIRGAYHYAKPSSRGADDPDTVWEDATREAEAFVDAILEAEKSITGAPPLSRGCLMPVLDWEDTENPLGPQMCEFWIKVWIGRVEECLGRGVMIYTGDRVWEKTIGDVPTELTQLRLWVPRYTGVAAAPGCEPFPRWTFWQWSGGGDGDFYEKRYGHTVPGPKDPKTHTDVNAFAGTTEELERMTTGELDVFLTPRPEPTPEPLPPEPDPDKFRDLATLTRSLSDHLALVADDLDAIGHALTREDPE